MTKWDIVGRLAGMFRTLEDKNLWDMSIEEYCDAIEYGHKYISSKGLPQCHYAIMQFYRYVSKNVFEIGGLQVSEDEHKIFNDYFFDMRL